MTYTLNLGEAKSTGFDLSLTAQPIDGMTLDVAVGYVDTRYTRDVFLTNTATSGDLRIAAGNAIANAGTPWQASGAVRFDFDPSPRRTFARFEVNFASKYDRLFPSTDPRTISYDALNEAEPPFYNVKARVGMSFGNLDAQLFVDNLLNDKTRSDQFRLGVLSQFQVQRPRTAGLTLLYRTR